MESANTPDKFWAAIKKDILQIPVSNAGTVFEKDEIKTTNKQVIVESLFCKRSKIAKM